MKIKLSILLLIVAQARFASSQIYCPANTDPCCNGIISTGIPYAKNDERPGLKNNFDWTSNYWDIYMQDGGTHWQSTTKLNPFYSTGKDLSQINFSSLLGKGVYPGKSNLDFQPSDGWELVHKDDGYLADQKTLQANDGKHAPHVILYNKYRGIMRVIAGMSDAVPTGGVINSILVELANSQNNININGVSFAPNGLFNRMESPITALDTQSGVITFGKGVTPAGGGSFIVADFPINYDPCICNFQNFFNIEFSTLTKMDIQLGGRLIGTNVPLDANGDSQTINGKDFLTAVSTNGDIIVNGGALTYSNIDDLAANYKSVYEPTSTDPVTTFFFNTLKNGIGSALGGIGGAVDSELNKQASVFYKTQFGGQELLTLGKKVLTLPEKLDFGITLASQGTKMLGALLFPESEKVSNPLPQISFIEAEMVLSGHLTGKAPLNNDISINFAIPGSKYTLDATKTPDASYPTYNEPLGLFSLLETPTGIVQYTRTKQTTYGPPPATDPFSVWGSEKLNFSLNKSSIKYAFNPSAEIDVENTKIYASLELEEINGTTIFNNIYQQIKNDLGCPPMDDPYINMYACSLLKNITYTNSGDFFENVAKDAGTTQKYSTSIMPIECLTNTSQSISFNNLLFSELTASALSNANYYYYGCPSYPATCMGTFPSYFKRDKKLVLKLHIDYVFKMNKYGKINRYFEILTYPVSLTDGTVTTSNTNSTSQDVSMPSAEPNYKKTGGYNVWNSITVDGVMNLTSSNNNVFTYSAGTEIDFVPGAEVSGESVFSISTSNLCGDKILPVTSDYVNTFCTTKYFAKNFTNFRMADDAVASSATTIGSKLIPASFNIYPNPTAYNATIQYNLTANSIVNLYISDLYGEKVADVLNTTTQLAGNYATQLNTSVLPAGTYFCTLEMNGEKHVQRLVIVK